MPPDDTIITKDLPSDLNSTFAEDSNVSLKIILKSEEVRETVEYLGWVVSCMREKEKAIKCNWVDLTKILCYSLLTPFKPSPHLNLFQFFFHEKHLTQLFSRVLLTNLMFTGNRLN